MFEAKAELSFGVDLSEAMAELAARRLDAAAAGDMRRLPIASQSVAGLLAFYSIIHIPRAQLEQVFEEFMRVLKPGGRLLMSAHEGQGEIQRSDFLGEAVPFVATMFEPDELVVAAQAARLKVARVERRPPYPEEYETFRLYIYATKPQTL